MAREIKITADKIYNRKKRYTKLKTFLGLIFLLLIFVLLFLVLYIRVVSLR